MHFISSLNFSNWVFGYPTPSELAPYQNPGVACLSVSTEIFNRFGKTDNPAAKEVRLVLYDKVESIGVFEADSPVPHWIPLERISERHEFAPCLIVGEYLTIVGYNGAAPEQHFRRSGQEPGGWDSRRIGIEVHSKPFFRTATLGRVLSCDSSSLRVFGPILDGFSGGVAIRGRNAAVVGMVVGRDGMCIVRLFPERFRDVMRQELGLGG
ncbi:hypothetical protein EJ06DRAFT_133100 [Trichodelitschia bisporula]|uniref:Uncharacterized protein n=1 Tax=Trichodelitschia bisporula TaxID=703511 RepID=A0A6G1HP63_9PEZI|nr:hypothetical protein EJ06DRAFT_133100 [Trichodelitschia bisporula]